MLVVAAGLLLAGCCRSNKISISQDVDDIPILLSVKSTGTKAIIDESDDSNAKQKMIWYSFDGGGFGVHGYKTVNTQSPFHLFDNTRVYPAVSKPNNLDEVDDANTPWTYSPLRFWDLTASYQFLAYWPILPAYNANNSSVLSVSAPDYPATVDAEILTIHNVPNWQPVNGSEKDLMTAAEGGRFSPDFYTGVVPLHFKHMLSQLVIKAYYIGVDYDKNDGPGVKIKDIILGKSANNDKVLGDGSTDMRQAYSDNTASPATGEGVNGIDMADSYTLLSSDKLSDDDIRVNYKDEADDDTSVNPSLVGKWLFIPHKWQDLTISVNRKFGNKNTAYSEPVPVTLGTQHDSYRTLPGKIYVLTLMFDTSDGGLTVASVDVQNWTEQKVTREVYNW